MPNLLAITYHASDYSHGREIAASRHPQLICVQMDDPRDLATFAREIHAILPETAVAVLYHPDQFGPNESESRVIIELLRVNVHDFLRRPLASTELRQLVDRLFAPRAASQPTVGKILSFISNKGGVGKSTLSVSVACELARRNPGRVLLVDVSLQLGIGALMLQNPSVPVRHENSIQPRR